MSKKLLVQRSIDLLNYKENDVLLSTSSSISLMESSIQSFILNRLSEISCGSFDDIWYKIGVLNSVLWNLFKIELGKAIGSDMVDKVLSTNKHDIVM